MWVSARQARMNAIPRQSLLHLVKPEFQSFMRQEMQHNSELNAPVLVQTRNTPRGVQVRGHSVFSQSSSSAAFATNLRQEMSCVCRVIRNVS